MESASTEELRALCVKHGVPSSGTKVVLMSKLTTAGVIPDGAKPPVVATGAVVKPYVEGTTQDVDKPSIDVAWYLAEQAKILASLPDGVVPEPNAMHAEIVRRYKLHVKETTEDGEKAEDKVIVQDQLSKEECAAKNLTLMGKLPTGEFYYKHTQSVTDDASAVVGKRPADTSTLMSPQKSAKTAASSSASSTASKKSPVMADAEPVAPDVLQAAVFGKHVVQRIMQAGVPPKSILNLIQYFDADYKSASHKTNVKQLVVHLMANDSDEE